MHLQLQAGATLFASNMCLFSTNLGAVDASATGISTSPSVLSLRAAGDNVTPDAISLSPVSYLPSPPLRCVTALALLRFACCV